MSQLFGTDHSATSLAAYTGRLSQVGGVRLCTLEDGAGRGVRMLDFDTGSGLRFSLAVDRALDIAELSHNGRAIGWHAPAGLRHPAFADSEGEDGYGWNRSFSGFLATCGLDHIFGPEEVPSDSYNHPGKSTVRHGIHGRISATPARLTGYGEVWRDATCILWAEATTIQATLFGEVLHLTRRIEAALGSNTLTISDRVTNAGFARTPHMLMYHFNLGYPLLDTGTRFLAPIEHTLWASHADVLAGQSTSYRSVPAPTPDFREQVWQHDLRADAQGRVPMAVVNDALGFGVEIETHKAQLPCAIQWQNFRSGNYVMGIEPATHHVKGNLFARERGEMIWLNAQDSRSYDTRITVLNTPDQIATSEARISAICPQPDTDYPTPTNTFPPLTDAGRA
jgi:hypothetical protein